MANDFKASVEALSADELFLLHLDVTDALRKRLEAKKHLLDQQLRRLHPTAGDPGTESRRPYPSGGGKISQSGSPLRKLVRTW
jgi:hypothetical protein